MDKRTEIIPASRKNMMFPPPARRRPMRPWIMQAAMFGAVIVMVFGVLVEVAKSSSIGSDGKTLAFNASVKAYQLTYAAHCEAGVPFTVRNGETLASIANRLGVSVTALATTNGLGVTDPLIVGEVLCPAADNVTGSILVGTTSLEPCQSQNYWLPVITQWAVPPGCYGNVYTPNPANYPYRPTWGWCNWWPEETHPHLQGDAALLLPKHHTPIVGATVWFDPYEQGASGDGHFAELVAINPDGYWLLISEMNNNWRGAGWGRIDYRYIHVSPGIDYMY